MDDYFSPSGDFSGRLPEDFFRFTAQVEEREDIHIGEDDLNWAHRLAAEASQKLRSEEILRQIENSRGNLPGINARLYPYQIQGTGFLVGNGRALLADDMGLGKTLQVISAAVWLKTHENIRTVMIICPASLKQQWSREIAKFTDLQCQIIQGPPPKRGVQYRREKTFFVINYELILRDLSMINESLQPDLIILDEAQRIKNWRTKIATAAKLIPTRYAFVLTGTPLENRLEDLYSLMQGVDPKILGPLWRYMVNFHLTDERGKVLGYRNLSILRKRLAPVMLRRDRSIVSDQLPERIIQRLDVPMTAKQREFHDDAVQVFISTDAGGVGLNLQSGSALINMDVPWNPAVLEQRNARIHRLGQKRSVQLITLVSAASYEEQVLALVQTKQHLFDNVVKEDATEDVVGVSKNLFPGT